MTVSWQKDDYNVIHVDPKAVPDMDKRYMDIQENPRQQEEIS